MVFSSMTFLTIALPLALVVCYLLPRGLRNGWLLLFSLVFYAWGEPVLVLLMLASNTANYFFGLALWRTQSPGRRKMILAAAVVMNLGALFLFKYLGFSLRLANRMLGTSLSIPEIALPLGISFYTFQALSYVIDVYRGDVPVQKRWMDLALYISFFPQLIAGPILRYDAVEPQLQERRQSLDLFWQGLRRFAVGLSKKVLIANAVATVADEAFSASGLTAGCAWLGAIAYALQILFDFSGYSDMAIGLGAMFGFHYPENFNAPYTAVTIRDFWRRWHISLSTWFRDYLYIPLGGSRRGKARHALNLLLVFLVTGLWHGAGMTFLVWGLYYGILSALSVLLNYHASSRLPLRLLQRCLTLLLVLAGWVLFRADSLAGAALYLRGMITGGCRLLHSLTPRAGCAIGLGALLSSTLPQRAALLLNNKTREALSCVATPLLLLLCLMTLASGTYNPFIYFRF